MSIERLLHARCGAWRRSGFSPVRAAAAGLALAALPAAAKQSPPVAPAPQVLDTRVHDAGRVHCLVTNWGMVGSMPGTGRPYSNAPSAQWPAQDAADYLWAGGLWIGALKNGEPHVTTAVYQNEFRPGPAELDRIYATQAGAPGGARRPSPDEDDDHDGRIDEDRLDGRDNDLDGRIDEDFAAISQQMFACEYTDTDPAIVQTSPEHVPLEVSIEQSSLAWAAPAQADFIGFDLRLINHGFNPLDQVYIGFFADCDIGLRGMDNVSEDDRAGFWEGRRAVSTGNQVRNVTTSLGYMFDADGDGGTAPGYIGFVFLGAEDRYHAHPANQALRLRNFRMFSGRASFANGGDPANDAERYLALAGGGPDSLPPSDPQTGFRPARVAARNDDYRILLSIGPFATVDPGDTVRVQFALVLGDGFEGMLATAQAAQTLYDGAWYDCDRDPATGVLGREAPVCAPAGGFVRADSCDAACDGVPEGMPPCWVQIPDPGCEWVNGDCAVEAETGVVTGVQGAECVVHWTTDATVPVSLQDLQARGAPGVVHLTWTMAEPPQDGTVFVWRADQPEGPFTLRTEHGLAPSRAMAFDDAVGEGASMHWYRIVLEDAAGRQLASGSVQAWTGRGATALAPPVVRSADAVDIAYSIGEPGAVELAVFDAAGRRIRTLDQGPRAAGSYAAVWDRRSGSGSRAVRGIYFVRLTAGGARAVRKLVVGGD